MLHKQIVCQLQNKGYYSFVKIRKLWHVKREFGAKPEDLPNLHESLQYIISTMEDLIY